MRCMSQGRWTEAGDNPQSRSQQDPHGREGAHGNVSQESKRGKQEEGRTGGAITSRAETVSDPVGGLGLFKPTCPALGSGPAENQQEDEEAGTISFSLVHQTPEPQSKASRTAELEDVVQGVLDQKNLQGWSTTFPICRWT